MGDTSVDVGDAEGAVLAYLLALRDPRLLIDQTVVSDLEREVAQASDPIDKIKALAALRRAQSPDRAFAEARFVAVARAWADANDVPPATFVELGVSADVLRSAGFVIDDGGEHQFQARRTRSVTVAAIEEHIVRHASPTFTFADIARDIGGSPMTIRKAVRRLEVQGKVERLGPMSSWPGPGRAPVLFRTL